MGSKLTLFAQPHEYTPSIRVNRPFVGYCGNLFDKKLLLRLIRTSSGEIMRELTAIEYTQISAAKNNEALIAGGLFLVGLGITSLAVASERNSPYGYHYGYGYCPVTRYTDVITPVYDRFGFYQGDIIDTYETTDWVPCY